MAQDEDLRVLDGAEAAPCPSPVRDDRELLAAWVGRRDAGALQVLLDRHRPAAVRVCQRILRDPAEAEDAAQEACIALAGLDAMVEGEVAAWIRGCAAKAALQQRRARVRRRRRELRTAPPSEGAVGDLLTLVDECVELLPEQDRRLIGDYFYLERTQAEIAASAGISQVAVHKRLRAALDRLQALMRRRGVRLGTLALLATMLGGTAAARSAARDLGLGGVGLVSALALAAVACVGLGIVVGTAWLRPAPAPAATSPERSVLARRGFAAGDWRVVAREAGAGTLDGGMVRPAAPLAEVPFGWRGLATLEDGEVLRLAAGSGLQLGIRAGALASAGAPYAFRLELWERTDGDWRRALHRSAVVRRGGAAEIFISVQYFDAEGRQIGSVPPPQGMPFPDILDNHGTIYAVSGPVSIRDAELRLMSWDEVLELARAIDPSIEAASLQPIAISADIETRVPPPDPQMR